MRYSLTPLFAISLLGAGCAGTQQGKVEPVANPVVITATVPALPAEAVTAPVVAVPAPAVVVAEAVPANPVSASTQPQSLDPLQCMAAWAKNVQGALIPQAPAGEIHAAVR